MTLSNKFHNLYSHIKQNINYLDDLIQFTYTKNIKYFSRKVNIITIDTTPTYYDLYKFDGITELIGTTSPSPASAYTVTPVSDLMNSYDFIYPVFGFAVPLGDTPETYTNGATSWTFQTTIAIVKTIIHFPLMPDWAINGCKIISYLTSQDGSIVQNNKFILYPQGADTEELSVELSEFYRWVKLDKGYKLEYYAIYPIPSNQQISLNTKLYIYNPKYYNHVQSTEI